VLAIADRSTGWEGADEVSRVLEMAVSLLAAETVVVPELDTLLRDSALYLVSARADIDAFLSSRPGLSGRSFLELYDDGVFPEGLDLARLLATRSHDDPHDRTRRVANRGRLRAAIVRSMSGFDALVYPTVQVPAPRRDRPHPPSRMLPVNTLIASQADLPAVTIPAGTTSEGLPIGLELLGRPGTDGALLRLAGLVERVLRG
jgi:Asp-tRNA(Asn)/Glu-tRNA(Gln) amidotransferase A subunit family amidase